MLLLDQGLPRSTSALLSSSGLNAVHVGDIGLATAEDATILQRARELGRTVVTLDADFHALLALTGAASPSVIRLRIEGLRADKLARLLLQVTEQCREELKRGALVTVTEDGIRLRGLPLIR